MPLEILLALWESKTGKQILLPPCFSSNLILSSCKNPADPYICIIDFGRTIGPFRCWYCQAHVQTLFPNIDEPS